MAGLRIHRHDVTGALGHHQLRCVAQRGRRLDLDDRLPRERRGGVRGIRTHAGPEQVEVGDDPPHGQFVRLAFRRAPHDDAVNVVRAHDPGDLGECRLSVTRENPRMHGIGYGRVLEMR